MFLATIENKIGDIIIAIILSLKLNCSKCCTKSKNKTSELTDLNEDT